MSTHASGIYVIRCTPTGKVYVGSAVNLNKRFNYHRARLKRGIHDNGYLQKAWIKYGADAFEFAVLEYVEEVTRLIEREQHYIDLYRAAQRDHGYNINIFAGSALGMIPSPEHRAKLSAAFKGRYVSPETRAKISAATKGKPHSPEHTAKMRASKKGTLTPELMAKMAAGRVGKPRRPHTPETKAKMSVAKKGRPRRPRSASNKQMTFKF